MADDTSMEMMSCETKGDRSTCSLDNDGGDREEADEGEDRTGCNSGRRQGSSSSTETRCTFAKGTVLVHSCMSLLLARLFCGVDVTMFLDLFSLFWMWVSSWLSNLKVSLRLRCMSRSRAAAAAAVASISSRLTWLNGKVGRMTWVGGNCHPTPRIPTCANSRCDSSNNCSTRSSSFSSPACSFAP